MTVATEQKMNHYLLVGNRKAESWQVSQNVPIMDGKKRRFIRYVEGEQSIFVDEQHPRSEPTHIWLTKGSLYITASDTVKNRFLKMHPDNPHKFFLHDPEAINTRELDKIEHVEDVKELLRDLNQGQREAVATVLFGLTITRRWSEKKIKLELFKFVDQNPDKIKTVINDPVTEMTYLVAAAIKLSIIEVTNDKTSVIWCDTKLEIIPIPKGVNPIREMSLFMRTDEGLITLQEIGDRVNKTQGKKVTRKTAKKATTK